MGRVRGRKRRRVPRFFGITFRLVLIVAAACLFLSYISSYIDPSKFSLPLFFGLYFIPILFVNILLFLIAVLSRSKSAWITVVALLPALLFTERFFRFGSSKKSGAESNAIKIETYNVGRFILSASKQTKAATMDSVVHQIQNSSPDIVCLQEMRLDSIGLANKVFPGYRYRTFHLFGSSKGKRTGNMILSKYEIINGGVLKFKQSTNLSLYADIVINKDTVRVYNNHLESYAISPTALIKRIREKKSKSEEVAEEIINVHTKLKNTVIRRSGQVSSILKNIHKSPYPAIICGDFNDTPMSFTYHKLSYGSLDTFKESGRGFSATYSMLWPLLRIDYIFIPKTFKGFSHQTLKVKHSDHYPVIAEFSPEKNEKK
ncbi:MAG: endonuclease/exonuclease/phosphatase family protein [Bacteroidales bacterium]|nr:endonuclease/exonuclease/phosphatase family protein [Bacteroidales bacterium]